VTARIIFTGRYNPHNIAQGYQTLAKSTLSKSLSFVADGSGVKNFMLTIVVYFSSKKDFNRTIKEKVIIRSTPPEQYHSARKGSGAHPGNKSAPAIHFLLSACSGHSALSWPEDKYASQYLSVSKSHSIQVP